MIFYLKYQEKIIKLHADSPKDAMKVLNALGEGELELIGGP